MVVSDDLIAALQGSAVELFQLRQSDVSAPYISWLSNSDVTQYLEVRFATPQVDELLSYVEHCLVSPNILLLGIRERVDGRHVGNIKVAWSPNHLVGDVGIMLGDPVNWGRGYGSQAVRLLSRFALDSLHLRKLVAGIYRSNVASVHTFCNAGFEQEAVLRGHALLDGRPEDVLLFSIFGS